MKIAIVSDLHLEFADLIIKNDENADVLVLAGDIMIAQDLHDHPEPEVPYPPSVLAVLGTRQKKAQIYRDFLKRVSLEFPHVIMIAGNHEFYHGKWNQSLDTLRDECEKFNNVHFMERNMFQFQDVTFVGGTLWTDMNRGDPLTLHAVQDFMHDYRMIRHDGLGYTKLRPAHTLARHRETLEYFRFIIDERKDQKVVVVSHMAPSSLSIHDMYKSEHLTNGAYYSDLSEFILDREQIKLYIHGHMHHAFDYMIGNTRVVCNPRGYVGYERGTQDAEPYYPQYVEV
jgi:Icc-related predicted phosphoesterase